MNKYSNYKIVKFKWKLRSFKYDYVTPPIYVRIKPTNKCNHNCRTCIYKPEYVGMHSSMSRNDELSKEKLLEVVEDLYCIGVKAITWSGGGEPLMHPNIIDAIEKARQRGLEQAIITNGQELEGRRLCEIIDFKWVRVSFDYYDRKSFKKTRGVNGGGFDKVLQNSKDFAKYKDKDCDFGANFIVTASNYMHLFDIASRLKDIGFENIRFSPLWVGNFTHYHRQIEPYVLCRINECRSALEDDNFKVYDSYDIDFQSQSPVCDRCYVMQVVPVVAADYNVYACHNKAYDEKGLIGSIKDKSFKDLWFSDGARKIFETFKPLVECKGHQCSSNKRNILITDILDADGLNFI